MKEEAYLPGRHVLKKAANLAAAGDRIAVREDVYREWVRPRRGGLNDDCRIVYGEGEQPKAGPLEALRPGKNRVKVWTKK